MMTTTSSRLPRLSPPPQAARASLLACHPSYSPPSLPKVPYHSRSLSLEAAQDPRGRRSPPLPSPLPPLLQLLQIASDGAWLGVIHGEEDRLYNSTPTQSSAVSLSQSEQRPLLSPALYLSQSSPAASCALPAMIPTSQPATDAEEEAVDAEPQGDAAELSVSAGVASAPPAVAETETAAAAAADTSEDERDADSVPAVCISAADQSTPEAVRDVQPPLNLSALLVATE